MRHWNPPLKLDATLNAAERLRRELRVFKISADINAGKGIALVSVWADLIVWTHGELGYWWWSGRFSSPGRKLYTWGPVRDPVSVARRVAYRFAETCRSHPYSMAITEMLNAVPDGWELPPLAGQAGPADDCQRTAEHTVLADDRLSIARHTVLADDRLSIAGPA